MIDYDKLKLAHDLARQAEVYLRTSLTTYPDGNVDTLSFNCSADVIEHGNVYVYVYDLDALIAKLQKLTQTKNKINAWYIDGDFKIGITSFDKKELEEISAERKLHNADAPMRLYPSREALIDAQIHYWTNLLNED